MFTKMNFKRKINKIFKIKKNNWKSNQRKTKNKFSINFNNKKIILNNFKFLYIFKIDRYIKSNIKIIRYIIRK